MLFSKKRHATLTSISKQKKQSGFNELLSYLLLYDETTIVHKDFALSQHFKITLPDLNVASTATCDQTAYIWQQAMSFLSDGWMLEVNVLSQLFSWHGKENRFPCSISKALHDERMAQLKSGHYFTTDVVLSLTYKPNETEKKAFEWFRFETQPFTDNHAYASFQSVLAPFHQGVKDFVGFLAHALVHIEVLMDNELVTFLNTCITGNSETLIAPPLGCFLDSYCSSDDFIAGLTPKIGNQFIHVLALDVLPQYSYPMILNSLSELPLSYRWSNRFVPLSQLTAETYLKRYQRHWSSKAIGFVGVLRESLGLPVKLERDAQMTADTIDDALVENRGGQRGFGFLSSNIVLMHKDKDILQKMSDYLKQTIQQLHFKVRQEKLNATEAYLGSLPSHGDYNVRKILVDTQYLSHALPLSVRYQGETTSPCPLAGYHHSSSLMVVQTRGNRPFFLNLHVGDVGHSLILGATGSGKSTLVSWLLCNHRRYSGSRIIVLDKDASQRLAIRALQGRYLRLGEENETQLAPFVHCEPKNTQALDVAQRWLCDAMLLFHVDMTAKRQQVLQEALLRLSHEEKIFRNLNHLHLEDPALRDALRVINSGLAKTLLNGEDNPFHVNDVMGIDCGALLQNNTLTAHAVIIIDALFNHLNALFVDQRPTILVIEEAWLYLKHPIFQAKLSDWLKTLRKANVAVILVSQDIADIANSPLQSSIQSACMTRIYCANPAANEEAIKAHYLALGLTLEEVHFISHMQAKKDYYWQTANHAQCFQLDLGALAKAILCETDKEKKEALERLLQSKNHSMIEKWCKQHFTE